MLHTRCSHMGLEVRGHLRRRQRQLPLVPALEDARERKPESSASAHSMDVAACRYSTMAATAQMSRHSTFLRTTTALNYSLSVLPNTKLKINPLPLAICKPWDASATDNSKPRFIVWNATQKLATSRTIAIRSAAVGWVGTRRYMSPTSFCNCPATNGGACFTDTPLRRCSSCALANYPRTSGLATGFPRCSTGSQSLCLPSCSIIAYFSFELSLYLGTLPRTASYTARHFCTVSCRLAPPPGMSRRAPT